MYHRFDLYGPVHKGIRLALSGLSYQTGSVDSSDYDKVQAFIEEFRSVVIILESHSRDEDDNINESYEKFAPETLQELEQEHEGLEHKLEQLAELVNQLEANRANPVEFPKLWYQVGKELNRFTADYLIHLQREEGPGMKALWDNLNDDELRVISKNIRSSIPPHAMAIFMHYMIPAISHTERVEMFSEMKKFAPKEALNGMLGIAETRLDQKSWGQLQSALTKIKTEGVQNQV
ncbi:hemerythrin domain-containing protein [Bacillus sp. FJAT-29814]|uniref:hemerythrin domain-containing protein n=1 Tax=Bacillus sp. FJAT-29814 TaxID=1729688 RepID=UPI00082EA0E8|nr:hemerythrin domain-containing protein [Bacillus sp. FJAT-29814]